MHKDEKLRIVIAGGVGAIIGGLLVAVATDAIPRMMEEISSTMMGQMMNAGINAAIGEAETALADGTTTSPLYGLAYGVLRDHLKKKGAPNVLICIEN